MTTEFHNYHIEAKRIGRYHRFVAVCACGWKSNSFSTAGLAGAAFDRHEEKEHGNPSQ